MEYYNDYEHPNSRNAISEHILHRATGDRETWEELERIMLPVFDNCECMLFPSKDQRDWSKFHRPFKEGDIVALDSERGAQIFIFKEYIDTETDYAHCYMMLDDDGAVDLERGEYYVERFATEEEKQKLFKAIKDNGYKWNAETKTLEKLPKFKVGDRIAEKNGITKPFTISQVRDGYYYSHDQNAVGIMRIEDQDEYELVPNKLDITTLKPFESRVLVRDSDTGVWFPGFFGGLCDGDEPYMVIGGIRWKCCIPYEGNEHLLGKTDDCTEYYKTWE